MGSSLSAALLDPIEGVGATEVTRAAVGKSIRPIIGANKNSEVAWQDQVLRPKPPRLAPTLAIFPVELLCIIFSSFHPRPLLLVVSVVCRRWRSTALPLITSPVVHTPLRAPSLQHIFSLFPCMTHLDLGSCASYVTTFTSLPTTLVSLRLPCDYNFEANGALQRFSDAASRLTRLNMRSVDSLTPLLHISTSLTSLDATIASDGIHVLDAVTLPMLSVLSLDFVGNGGGSPEFLRSLLGFVMRLRGHLTSLSLQALGVGEFYEEISYCDFPRLALLRIDAVAWVRHATIARWLSHCPAYVMLWMSPRLLSLVDVPDQVTNSLTELNLALLVKPHAFDLGLRFAAMCTRLSCLHVTGHFTDPQSTTNLVHLSSALLAATVTHLYLHHVTSPELILLLPRFPHLQALAVVNFRFAAHALLPVTSPHQFTFPLLTRLEWGCEKHGSAAPHQWFLSLRELRRFLPCFPALRQLDISYHRPGSEPEARHSVRGLIHDLAKREALQSVLIFEVHELRELIQSLSWGPKFRVQ